MGGWPCSLCCNLDVSRAAHLAAPRQQLLAARWAPELSHRACSLAGGAQVELPPPAAPISRGLCAVHGPAVAPHAGKNQEARFTVPPEYARSCQQLTCIYVHVLTHAHAHSLSRTHVQAHMQAGMHTQHGPLHTQTHCPHMCLHTQVPLPTISSQPCSQAQPQVGACHPPLRSESKPRPLQGLRGTMWSGPTLVQGWSPDAPRLPLCLCAGSSWPGVLLPPRLTSSDPDCLHLWSSSCPDSDLSP